MKTEVNHLMKKEAMYMYRCLNASLLQSLKNLVLKHSLIVEDPNILFLPGNQEPREILSKYITIPRALIWTNGLNELNQNINSN